VEEKETRAREMREKTERKNKRQRIKIHMVKNIHLFSKYKYIYNIYSYYIFDAYRL
jgi:hypothetical protein